MSRPHTYKTEAVVLRQINLGEADRILTLYTPDQGKVRAVARGVRRPRSKLSGHLELLNQAAVSLSYGRNLDTINEAQSIQSFRGIRDDLQRISKAIYMAELVDAFTIENSGNHQLYLLLVHSLGWLERTENTDLLLRHFELHLLEASGYQPELLNCVECRTSLEPRDHLFAASAGGILCPECRVGNEAALIPISLNAMKVLRFLQRESGFGRVNDLSVPPDLVAALERLLRVYIRYLAERDLKSAEFMNLVSSVPQ
ncbi:MAG: DNA repair protein RecO [Chloroflexi bacterium]|nr:DNA repair protein RecO [Chloroflexota bacterium]